MSEPRTKWFSRRGASKDVPTVKEDAPLPPGWLGSGKSPMKSQERLSLKRAPARQSTRRTGTSYNTLTVNLEGGDLKKIEFGNHATVADVTNSVTEQLGIHAFADHFCLVLQNIDRRFLVPRCTCARRPARQRAPWSHAFGALQHARVYTHMRAPVRTGTQPAWTEMPMLLDSRTPLAPRMAGSQPRRFFHFDSPGRKLLQVLRELNADGMKWMVYLRMNLRPDDLEDLTANDAAALQYYFLQVSAIRCRSSWPPFLAARCFCLFSLPRLATTTPLSWAWTLTNHCFHPFLSLCSRAFCDSCVLSLPLAPAVSRRVTPYPPLRPCVGRLGQSCNDFVSWGYKLVKEDRGGYQKLDEVAILAACCVQIRHHLLTTRQDVVKSGIRDKHLAAMEKDRALQRFIPEEIANLFQAKALRKLLLAELRKLDKKDATACQALYVRRVVAASRGRFGLESLPAIVGSPPEPISVTADCTAVTCTRAGTADVDVICDVEQLSSVAMNVHDRKAVLHYMGETGANKSLHMGFAAEHEVESLCAMLEGYFRLQYPHRVLLVKRRNSLGEERDTFVGVQGASTSLAPPGAVSPGPQELGDASTINRDQLKITATLGAGQFGTVFRGTLTQNGRTMSCAIKSINSNESMEKEAFVAEAMLMKDLRHK